MKTYRLLILFVLLALAACGPDNLDKPVAPTAIMLTPGSVWADAEGGSYEVAIQAPFRPRVEIPAEVDWISFKDGVFEDYTLPITLTVAPNPIYTPREASLSISSSGTEPVLLKLTQEARPRPVNTGGWEGADDAVRNMGAGWNLGNTLDANSGDVNHMWIEAYTDRTPADYETAWGQAVTTPELIHMFKLAGFNAIRVPVTWYPHMGTIKLNWEQEDWHWDRSAWTGYEVDPVWMARVKEVVDYVIDEDMYCILNVHHDTGDGSTAWLVASEEGFEAARPRYQALWQQIAETFRDYGEHLLFESYNEMLDQYGSWCFASYNTPARYDAAVAASAYKGINSYAKLFVETVRASGGNNANRNLVVNTYGACSGDGTWNNHLIEPLTQFQIPEEPGHIAVQIHSYWEADKFNQQKADIDRLFTNVDTHLVKRLGVPVIIGEWGGGSGTDSDANVQFAGYFSQKAHDAGVAAFWWMGLSDGKEDRAKPDWTMPRTKNAIVKPYLKN